MTSLLWMAFGGPLFFAGCGVPTSPDNGASGQDRSQYEPPAYLNEARYRNHPDLPTLSRIWPETGGNRRIPTPADICHILYFYGLGETDLADFSSGRMALMALTNEESATTLFGESPFVRTRNGIRYRLLESGIPFGEAHRDQCLALFANLGLPLSTAITLNSGSYSIADLLSETIANFDLNQKELTWTATALAKYLPPRREWENRFGERTTFSSLAEQLMGVDLVSASCAGTHVLQTLIQILVADRSFSILSEETSRNLHEHVRDLVSDLAYRQTPEGNWGTDWYMSPQAHSVPTSFHDALLITGHLLEACLLLPEDMQPNASTYLSALAWLQGALTSSEIPAGSTWLCEFTHAARSAMLIQEFLSANQPIENAGKQKTNM